MTILGLLFAVIATIVIVWLTDRASVPPDKAFIKWIVYAILIVLWIVGLAYILGFDGTLSTRIGGDVD